MTFHTIHVVRDFLPEGQRANLGYSYAQKKNSIILSLFMLKKNKLREETYFILVM